MKAYTSSSFSIEKDGTDVVATIRHPKIPSSRKEAVDYLLANGCQLVPDVEDLPSWLVGLDAAIQRKIVEDHIELMNIYMLRIPSTATIASTGLRFLGELSELKHLLISHQSIAPEDLASLESLNKLGILTLMGSAFHDEHLSCLPRLPRIRMIDVQSTSATERGVRDLEERYPGVRIYSDYLPDGRKGGTPRRAGKRGAGKGGRR
jgi:hypothetical protein